MSSPSSEQPQYRNRPGSACAECRRRKMRCDGKHPECDNCSIAGIQCIFSSQPTRRGPKKGHLKTLHMRIAHLESKLMGQRHQRSAESVTDDDIVPVRPPLRACTGESQLDVLLQEFDIPGMTPVPPFIGAIPISELLHAELDQLYFDRVHVFAPIVNRGRYLSWSKDVDKSASKMCLQYAMWTMTASMSAQLDYLCDPLYRSARQLLDSSQLADDNIAFYQIEHVQAWLLLAIYEFTHQTFRRGWMSAGQGIRLVQMMNWHRIDINECNPGFRSIYGMQELICEEEKRRVFWMAYILDRFVSLQLENPLTFDERLIATRLPATEEAFQTGQLSRPTGFLSELITARDSPPQTELTDWIVLAALCGQSMLHRQQTTAEQVNCGVSTSFWERHTWLDAILVQKAQLISTLRPVLTMPVHPMALFLNLVAQSALLSHSMAVDLLISAENEMVLPGRQQALMAAQEIVRLTGMVSQLSYFEIHPFMPLPVIVCAKYLVRPGMDASCAVQLQEILGTVQHLASTNYLCREWVMQHSHLFPPDPSYS
ncbi:citrinin biosynthesis transcriptional activator CtnR [Aspergillus ibericus CBS 121593]|uniref:Citrinin biosynthesis transcriptional activator CtnR n=1 Tax=Aspergillus ibericus CBS 121593 TaxID=1448316 RepID=A0A395GNN0_9EURO|nr:citrinin biosynthesis transcriptional activator CtnR [Aspergillus ibericus CBS 121593]RAK96962.1 citrinin biosynthesis transcriptional activator CtnR [Aspergillus ibericus CBS 121593]